MAVYVDDSFCHGSWGKWTGGGHMQADTAEELHAFAGRLKLKREWFESNPRSPELDHYDLTAGKRDLALSLGAVAESWRDAAKRNIAEMRDRKALADAA